jgi:hypothetical protein
MSFQSVAVPKYMRGSKGRCLDLTSKSPTDVATALTALVQPFASVSATDSWMPRGAQDRVEAQLGRTRGFLREDQTIELRKWWLAVQRQATTPNWDIVSTCMIADNPGLLLVEAKAHHGEISTAGKSKRSNPDNAAMIANAISRASAALQAASPQLGRWDLNAQTHYQLANRFAWAWKLASMKIPVVLLYLGFLNTEDLGETYSLFKSGDEWRSCMLSHTNGIVPNSAWKQIIDVGGTPLIPLIRSL